MPDKAMERIMKGVDTTARIMAGVGPRELKGPLDRMAELRAKRADLEKRISAGESGDGMKKPDLRAQLRTVRGELRNLEEANPGK